MRVAALYDIHANIAALEAVLGELRHERIDEIVVGGDVVPGPVPRETVERLLHLDLPVHFIQGNCEVAVLELLAGTTPPAVPAEYLPIVQWTADQVRPDYASLFAGWPKTLRLNIPPIGDVLFCHGTPRHENECFTRLTAEDRLLPLFEPFGVPLAVCGHTHMPFDRMVATTRVVNAGSVGMPFGHTGADWLLIGPEVELRHTTYDVEGACARMRVHGFPDIDSFFTRLILQPAPEHEMLDLFSRAELKGS
jgi:predicted phosphodiesterase